MFCLLLRLYREQAAAYGQFGSGHLVDDYEREYRIIPAGVVHDSDPLPCDMDSIESSSKIYMNVRVRKRSREQKIFLLKDHRKRRFVLFPYIGEKVNVRYSTGCELLPQTVQN